MAPLEHVVDIAAPLETVYEFTLDPANWVRTNPALSRIDRVADTDAGVRATAIYDAVITTVPVTFELVVVEPYGETVVHFDGAGMSGEAHYTFTETSSGTTLAQAVEIEFGNAVLGRAIEPMARHYAAKQFETALETTKDMIETEAADA